MMHKSEYGSDFVEQTWEQVWKDIVAPDNKINVEQLKKELADFSWLMRAASQVYMHVTGGKISNPSTLPDVVCNVSDDYISEYVVNCSEDDEKLLAALLKRCYLISERHMSGYRLVIGFDNLRDLQDAESKLSEYK